MIFRSVLYGFRFSPNSSANSNEASKNKKIAALHALGTIEILRETANSFGGLEEGAQLTFLRANQGS